LARQEENTSFELEIDLYYLKSLEFFIITIQVHFLRGI